MYRDAIRAENLTAYCIGEHRFGGKGNLILINTNQYPFFVPVQNQTPLLRSLFLQLQQLCTLMH